MNIRTIFVTIAALAIVIAASGTAILSQHANAAAVNTFFDESQGGTITKQTASSQSSFEHANSENFHNHSQNVK